MAIIELLPFCHVHGLSAGGETHFATSHLPLPDCGIKLRHN